MNIEKNTKPIKPGQRYFLEIIATDDSQRPRMFEIKPYGRIQLTPSQAAQLYTTAAQTINRCRDCAHARQGSFGLRSVTCKENPGVCWDKMCKACEHFTPKEP